MATSLMPAELDRLRRKLLEQRECLERRIAEAQAESQRELDPVEATDDVADRSEVADTALAFGRLCTRQRDEIDDALLRMELAEYGVCETCGNPIEPERSHPQSL